MLRVVKISAKLEAFLVLILTSSSRQKNRKGRGSVGRQERVKEEEKLVEKDKLEEKEREVEK